jgi:hypothetical protein
MDAARVDGRNEPAANHTQAARPLTQDARSLGFLTESRQGFSEPNPIGRKPLRRMNEAAGAADAPREARSISRVVCGFTRRFL